jgi:uncharacterized membrane protein YdbT with pleckstrin-like domain
MAENVLRKFQISNRVYLTDPLRFLVGIFMVWWPARSKYTLTTQRLIIDRGVLSRKRDEVELYRVKDVVYHASLCERIWSAGNITLVTSQVSEPDIKVKGVKRAQEIREQIRHAVQDIRRELGVREVDAFQDPSGGRAWSGVGTSV